MKQLIYTCPIAVMWMMKYHNISFLAKNIQYKNWFAISTIAELMDYAMSCNNFEYMVRRDDMDKYEPRDGDVVEAFSEQYSYPATIPFYHKLGFPVPATKKEISDVARILMRNGKQWINPCEVMAVA